MADSASYATCGQRAATRRHRWARANEQVVTSKFREGEEPQLEDKRENDLSMSQAWTGRDALRDGMSQTGLGRRSVK